jgi:hypothetical protein
MLSEIWVGSGILKKSIPDPRVKKHRIQDPQHCKNRYDFLYHLSHLNPLQTNLYTGLSI